MAVLSIYALVYQVLYRNKSQFTINRIYLLVTLLLGLVIPLLSFDVFPYEVIQSKISQPSTITLTENKSEINYFNTVYFIGLSIGFVLFLINIVKILLLIAKTKFEKIGNCNIHFSKNQAFSFFNYIFVEPNSQIQLEHEKAHAKKLHSIDRLMVSLITLLFWFNPIVYIFRYLIIENHEYEADSLAIKSMKVSKDEYASKMMSYINTKFQMDLLNNYYSLIKNRIVMLTRKENQRWVYALMFPVIIGIFSAFTFKKYPVIKATNPNFEMANDTIPKDSKHKRKTMNEAKVKQTKESKASKVILDTVITYDPVTMKETIVVTYNHPNTPNATTTIKADKFEYDKNFDLEMYLKNLKLSGKTISRIDTITIFDPETYEETITIDSYDFPVEFSNLPVPKISFEKMSELINKHATNRKTVEIKK